MNKNTQKMRVMMITAAMIVSTMALSQEEFFQAVRTNNVNEIKQHLTDHPEWIRSTNQGFSPLMIATYNNQFASAQALFESGAYLDDVDVSGNTALMGASFKGNLEMAKWLLDNGASVNQVNNNLANALTFAATFGQTELVQLLLEHGANPYQQDFKGKTPLDYAKEMNHTTIIDLLLLN